MKQHKKIGGLSHRPFPVANVHFRPVGDKDAGVCAMNNCQGLSLFNERPNALFLVRECVALGALPDGLTSKEHGELSWEKAYRDQKAGKEPPLVGYPICTQCTVATTVKFLGGGNERRAAIIIARAVGEGKDVILYDRNLTRDKTYPSAVMGSFENLEEFRRKILAETL